MSIHCFVKKIAMHWRKNCIFTRSSLNNKRIEMWWRYLKETSINSCLPLLKEKWEIVEILISLKLSMYGLWDFVSFLSSIMIKKKRWTHWIIIEHYTLCPAGRKSFLCRNSEIFGCYYIKKGCRHKHSLFVWTYPGYAFISETIPSTSKGQ